MTQEPSSCPLERRSSTLTLIRWVFFHLQWWQSKIKVGGLKIIFSTPLPTNIPSIHCSLILICWQLDHVMNFSPCWHFSLPTWLKYCCDCMLNYFSPGSKRKFPCENWLRCENTIIIDALACDHFLAWAEKMIAITWIFQPVCKE